MKERMFSAGFSLRASLSLLGIFLVLAIVFHPPVAAAQITVSCNKLQDECFNKCNSEFDKKTHGEAHLGCVLGCACYRDLCLKHLGEIIKASAQEEMFLADAPLRLFEMMVNNEH